MGRVGGAGDELDGGLDYPGQDSPEVIFMLQLPGQVPKATGQLAADTPPLS